MENIKNVLDTSVEAKVSDEKVKACIYALLDSCDYDKTKLGFLLEAVEKDSLDVLKQEFIRMCPSCIEIETVSDRRLQMITDFFKSYLRNVL